MAAAVMMDNRKRPLDGISSPNDNPPSSKRLQVDSPSANVVNGTYGAVSPAIKTEADGDEEEDEDDDEGQNPAYKGLDVSCADELECIPWTLS